MTNPIDEYLHSKEAGFLSGVWGGMKGFAGTPVGQHATGAAATLGVLVAGRAALRGMDNVMLAITKKRDFNQMMEHNPDLKEPYQENTKQFLAQFTSLRSMQPRFSKDPIVAGTYMRQMSASPATAGTAVVSALAAGRGMAPGILDLPSGMPSPLKAQDPNAAGMHEARMGGMEQQADLAGEKAQREVEMHKARMSEMTRREERDQRGY